MDLLAQTRSSNSQLGAKLASKILLVTLFALLLGDYFLVRVLDYLQEIPSSYSLDNRTDGEVGALRSIALGFINPALMLLVVTALLKYHFREPIPALCGRLGMSDAPSVALFVCSFGVGMAYVFGFMALGYFFPPDEFVAPHPANIINHATITGKVIFVLNACTLVPLAEEILFRGVLYQGVANSWGKFISIVVSSIAFIAIHPGTIGTGYWVTHAALYLSPLLMIASREATGTLYAPIAAHAGYNFAEIFF